MPQAFENGAQGADLPEHARHLPRHEAAGAGVPVEDRPAQAAQREPLQLFRAGAGLFPGQIVPCHLVFQKTHGRAPNAPGHGGGAVPGLEQGLLVVGVDRALRADQQAGAQLSAAGAQGEGGQQLAGVRNAAGGHHGDGHRVAHLGHQGHGGGLAYVAAGLGALGNDAVRPGPLHQLGQRHRRHHGEDLGPGLLPQGKVGGWVARPGGDEAYVLLRGDLGHGPGLGVHEHDVHAEGLVGQAAAEADLRPKGVGVHAAPADQAHTAGVGDGGGEGGGGDVGHAALDQGKFRPQKFV